jgi:hypothetical protein
MKNKKWSIVVLAIIFYLLNSCILFANYTRYGWQGSFPSLPPEELRDKLISMESLIGIFIFVICLCLLIKLILRKEKKRKH